MLTFEESLKYPVSVHQFARVVIALDSVLNFVQRVMAAAAVAVEATVLIYPATGSAGVKLGG